MGNSWLQWIVATLVAFSMLIFSAAFIRDTLDPMYEFPGEMYGIVAGTLTMVTAVVSAIFLKKNGKNDKNGK